jgi:hypothetical protein
MKITTQVEVAVSLKTVLRDGRLSAILSVAVPYGAQGRSVSVALTDDQLDLGAMSAVQDAMQKAIDLALPGLLARAQAEAQAAHKVAIDRQEE